MFDEFFESDLRIQELRDGPDGREFEALESVIAPKLRTGRFKATDKLIEMLKVAPNMRSKKAAT